MKRKLVYGVGCNDAPYPVQIWRSSSASGSRKLVWICPYYVKWKGVLERCYSVKYQEKQPSYKGCSVEKEWLNLSNFIKWCDHQPNRNWRSCEIDKDILIEGNKLYSSQSAVFVDNLTNAFITDRAAHRGEFPLGVCWNNSKGKYQAQCSDPFKNKNRYIGMFTCPNEAHEAWRKRKHELACQLADLQTDIRVANALRIRYSEVKTLKN